MPYKIRLITFWNRVKNTGNRDGPYRQFEVFSIGVVEKRIENHRFFAKRCALFFS